MNLTIFNGSPRGKKSNTKFLLDKFSEGFTQTAGNICEVFYLNNLNETDKFVEVFGKSENILLAFPLYVDCMPAITKNFIERLEPYCGKMKNTNIGFIVQSGFPESVHSVYVSRYLEKLSKRLGCSYKGTIIKGGVEGIQVMPDFVTGKFLNSFYELGKEFGLTGEFNKKLIEKLAQPRKIPYWTFKISKFFGEKSYWDKMLKENNAFEKRYDKPFQIK